MEKATQPLESFVADKLHHIEQVLAAEHASLNACLRAKLATLRAEASGLRHSEQDVDAFEECAFVPCTSPDELKTSRRESIGKWLESDVSHPAIPMPNDDPLSLEPWNQVNEGSPQRVAQAGRHLLSYPSSTQSPPPQLSQTSKNSLIPSREQTTTTARAAGMARATLLQSARHSRCSATACDSVYPINTEISCLRNSGRASRMLVREMVDFRLRESFQEAAPRTSMRRGTSASSRLFGDSQKHDNIAESFCQGIHPDSWLVMAWDLVSIVLVAKDLFMIPLHAFDADTGPGNSLDTIARSYWTANLCLRFFVGYEDKGGNVMTNIILSAKNYVRTWFGLDLLYVLLDWLLPHSSSGTAVQFILQLLRLMLVKRVKELINFIAMHVRSERASLILSVTKTITTLLFLAHLLACGWYHVSRLDGNNNWVRLLNLEGESFWPRYAVAIHWSFLQYSGESLTMPQNGWEQAYTISVQFVAYVLSAIMLSNLTSLMTQIQLLSARNNQQVSVLKRFLSDNKVSAKLAARIITSALTNIEEKSQRMPESSVGLLNEISSHLLVELHYNLNAHHLMIHPFFQEYDTHNQHCMRNLCDMAVRTEFLAAGDVIFSLGDVPTNPCMYFVGSGCTLAYDFDDSERILFEGTCVNEAALWLRNWEQVGTLRTKEATRSVQIVVQPCLAAMMQFRKAEFYPGTYALAFLTEMLDSPVCELTDIAADFLDLESLAATTFNRKQKLSSISSMMRTFSDGSASLR